LSRLLAAVALAGVLVPGPAQRSSPTIEKPLMFDTPEADRVLEALQVFPPDNPWHEDIRARPRHPLSDAMVRGIGADLALGYNLDMNFVIVPPDQPRVPVRIVDYPMNRIRGHFRSRRTRRSRTGRSRTTKTRGRCPRRGRRWRGSSAKGPAIGISSWSIRPTAACMNSGRPRLTPTGWQASQASTFDLTSNQLRREGWTSADAAGLPIFPAVVRYDEVARGRVDHALRVTVRRTRRAYVHPARHFASRLDDETLPRMGERLRLRQDFDVTGFPPHARAILTALKTYGMFVADNGSEWLISIAPDRRIQGLESLSRVKGSDFEVIVPSRE
jgi:hypothetical protein